MNDDIDKLIAAMKQQFIHMRSDYGTQLDEIERQFERERDEILARNEEEVKALFDRHKATEKAYQEKREKNEEEYAKQLEELRSDDANQQAEMKIKLEKEMQILEKCMEDMRAVYRLNEEKLEFNHKVLSEREAVNNKTQVQLKEKKRKF